MTKNVRLYHFITILVMVLLIGYTYKIVLALGFEEEEGSFSSIVNLVIVTISVFVLVISGNKVQTSFSLLWIMWSLWLVVDFFVLGLRGDGASNIIRVVFCPMTFVFFYTVSLYSDKIRTFAIIGFLILYIVSYYLILLSLNQIMLVEIGEEIGITNLIYWCLCPLPFLLLIKKPWARAVAIGLTAIIVLLTGKRSASIAIALIALVFVFNTSQGRHKVRNMMGILAIGIILYFVIHRYVEGAFLDVMERMDTMGDSQGSGRIPLYKEVLNVMKSNSFIDWVFGRGYGSIHITHHTNAHNDALQMLFEYGIIGLVVYVTMIVYLIKRMRVLRKSNSVYYAGYMASFVITIVLGLVSNLFVFYSYFAFLCAYWGIAEANLIKGGQLKRLIIK